MVKKKIVCEKMMIDLFIYNLCYEESHHCLNKMYYVTKINYITWM